MVRRGLEAANLRPGAGPRPLPPSPSFRERGLLAPEQPGLPSLPVRRAETQLEAPEIGGATSASPVACRALQAAVPPRLRSRHGDLRVSASSKCLPCCLMLCWDVRFRPACLDSSHSSKHLIQVKLGLTGTTIPMKHYVHASVSARPSMLVSIGWPTGSGVLIGPWPEATDSGKGKSSQYGGGARLGAATVAGDDGG